MKLKLFVTLTAVTLAVAASHVARAQAPSGTLAKIKDTGEIRLGHRDVSIPFSYLDDQQKPIGFAMDLCGKVVDAVKAELKLPSVQVKLQPIQLSNQIPLMQNGTIDIVCGPATNTLERQKVVAFSDTIFVSSIRAVVRNDGPIKSFEDLAGKPVAVTAASTSIGLLTAREQEKNFQTIKIQNPDHAASFLTLTTGRAEAFVMDDILLASLVASSSSPGNWRIIDDALRCRTVRSDPAQGRPGVQGAGRSHPGRDDEERRISAAVRQVVHEPDSAEERQPQLPHDSTAEGGDPEPERSRRLTRTIFASPCPPDGWTSHAEGTLSCAAPMCHTERSLYWNIPMATTTIRISNELKARVAAAAERAGKTSHGFILEAIAEKAEQEEPRSDFDEVAERRLADIVASGKTIPWVEMRTYLEDRLAGKAARRPIARKLAR